MESKAPVSLDKLVNTLLLTAFFLLLGIRTLESLVPYYDTDTLAYTLPFARLIDEIGIHKTYQNLGGSLNTGLFDFIFYLPVNFTTYEWQGHILSQFISLSMSLILTTIFSFLFFFKHSTRAKVLFSISILSLHNATEFFLIAKNDGFLACAFLWSAYLFVVKKLPAKSPITSGFILGCLTLIKLSGAIYGVSLIIAYYVYFKIKVKDLLKISFVAIIVSSPIYIRNFLYSGNPFYPGMYEFFSSYMTYSLYESMKEPLELASAASVLKGLFLAKWSLIFLVPFVISSAKSKEFYALIFLAVLYGVLFSLCGNGWFFYRYYISIPLIVILAFMTCIHQNYLLKSNIKTLLIFGIVFLDFNFSESTERLNELSNSLPKITQNSSEVISKITPSSKMWQHINKKKGTTYIISDDFEYLYYAGSRVILHVEPYLPGFDIIYTCEEKEKLAFLKKNYDYAILHENKLNPCYDYIRSQEHIATEQDILGHKFDLYKLKN